MIALQEIEAKLEAGAALNASEITALAEMDDLLRLGALADEHRRRRHGTTTTFVRVQELRLDGGAAPDVEVAPEAGEVRLVGEVRAPEEAVRAVRAAVAAGGAVPVTGFSLGTLGRLCDWQPGPVGDLLTELREAGLALVAEAGAERLPGPDWLDVVGRAGLRVGRITVGDVEDHGGVELVTKVAGWGDALGHAHAFAPLSRVQPPQPTTGYRDLRQVALARLLVDNIDSIQIDWSLYGPKLAQVALMFGANDIDTVSPDDTPDLGWRRAPREEVIRNIQAAGLTPSERNGRFEILAA